MNKKVNLLEGDIFDALIKLALPIMGASFIQMAYNLIDMIWIGRVGSQAVAAVGTGGFYMWLSMGFIRISKMGAQVKVAQSMGAENYKEAKIYARNALQLNFIIGILYSFIVVSFADKLIEFFNLKDEYVINQGIIYLKIVGMGVIFPFTNQVMTSIIMGTGNSKTPFKVTSIGLILNLILDPLLIFGISFFPKLGIKGAAYATIISQGVVLLIYITYALKDDLLFNNFKFLSKLEIKYLKDIVKVGLPTAVQSFMFTFFSMLLARIIAVWGPAPIAVQRIGNQIESISWMTADGFSSALNSFAGQNYGAAKYDRIKNGYSIAIKIILVFGIIVTMAFVLLPGQIFSIFITEKEVLPYGIEYLQILGVSQIFMCIELVSQGAFAGVGKTVPPSIVGIVFNALRIPMALILSNICILGLAGVWWSITISSIFKGTSLVIWFLYYSNRKMLKNNKVI